MFDKKEESSGLNGDTIVVASEVENESKDNKKKLIKTVVLAVVLALGSVGLLLLGVTYYQSHGKGPDLIITAPAEGDVSKPKSPFANFPEATSTVGGTLADKPFQNTNDGFFIKVPTGWHIDSSMKTGASVVLLSPETSAIDKNTFATFITVTVKEVGNIALKDQVEILTKNILEVYPNYQIEDNKETYLQGRIYYLLGGYYVTDGVKMRNRMIVTIYKGKGYAISATGPDDKWPENELKILLSMNSFGLL